MVDPGLPGEYGPGRPVPLAALLSGLRHGRADPSVQADPGEHWLAQRTPEGPSTLRLRAVTEGVLQAGSGAGPARCDVVHARAWGPGARWSLDRLPSLLGGDDDPDSFVPLHPVVRRAHRARPHERIPSSGLVITELVPVILEQRVTGKEAHLAYRRLVRAYGEPAPGPGRDRGLMVPPTPAQWRRVPSWVWLRAGVDAQRSDTIMRALSVAARLAECADLPLDQAHARLQAVPGIGRWTSAEIAQRALGDADAVSVGDYHVAKHVTHALEGRIGDDARMLQLLEPYRGHRYRVQRLIEVTGSGAPRRGPRMTLPTHLPR